MMPFGVGFGEIFLIFIVILLVVGPQKLPEVARTLGKGLRMVRKASDEFQEAVRMDDLRREVLDPARETWKEARRAGADLLKPDLTGDLSKAAPEGGDDEGEEPVPRGAEIVGEDLAKAAAEEMAEGPDEGAEEIEEIVTRARRPDLTKPQLLAADDVDVALMEAGRQAIAHAEWEMMEGDEAPKALEATEVVAQADAQAEDEGEDDGAPVARGALKPEPGEGDDGVS